MISWFFPIAIRRRIVHCSGARAVIEFHNWLWAELTPTEGSIRVLPMKDALEIIRA